MPTSSSGVGLSGSQHLDSDFLLYTDAFTHGWGCSFLHHTASDLWSEEESVFHFYFMELWVVWLAVLHFQHLLQGKTVGEFAETTTALAYPPHQGCTHFSALNNEAQWTLCLAGSKSISLQLQSISRFLNVVADSISQRYQVLSTKWTLYHEICQALQQLWGMPLMDLFAPARTAGFLH